ncbi:MAG: XdhC family protein, partial [Terracidiphilus sp.]
RFPGARQIFASEFHQTLAELAPSDSAFIVIATRGHRDDLRILRWAVQTPARYIGMIGSRRKAVTVFRQLVAEGLRPELFERVHSPIGLDIGAITPEEIAAAIVAELVANRRNVERALPHMSWFHSRRFDGSANAATDEPSDEAADGETSLTQSGN